MRYKWQYIKVHRPGCLLFVNPEKDEILYQGVFEAKNLASAKRLSTQAAEEKGVNWKPGFGSQMPKWYNLDNSSAKKDNGHGQHRLEVAPLNESNSS